MTYCNRRSLGIIISVVAMAWAAGCDSNSSAPDSGTCDPVCTDGKECIEGECKEIVKTCDPVCTDGKECVDGECKEIVKTCDPACTDGKECVDGECKEIVKTCDPACTDGKECVDGECIDPVCSDGGCEPDPIVLDCNPECTDKQTCIEGNCVDIDEPVIASFNVTPLEGLVTVQNRVDTMFTVSLDNAPQKDVILPIESSNPKAGVLSATQVTFTPENWDKPQSVKVTAAKEVMPDDETAYQVVVGPSKSDDVNYNGLDAVSVQIKHYNQFNTLKLDKTEASLLLRKVKKTSEHDVNSVTFTVVIPDSVTDKNVKWEINNLTDEVDVKKLIKSNVENDDKAGTSTITITRMDVDLKGKDNISNHLDWARTLQVSASTKDSQSVDAKLELKPYLPLGFNYGYYTKNIKDFSYKVEDPKTKEKYLEDLSCNYYDLHTTQVLNEDMYRYYVEPNMIVNEKGERLPTRASVLAAARFLTLQLPKDIPYSGTHKCVDKEGKKCSRGETTFASYTWTASSLAEGENAQDRRLFGLSLTSNGYNSLTSFESPIKDDIVSWGCSYKSYFNEKLGGDLIYNVHGKEVAHPNSGLCCSAYVSWALNNGMFDVGLLYTSAFAMIYDTKTKKNTERRVMNEETFYKSIDKINRSLDVYKLFKNLKETDFIPLSAVDKVNSVGMKAGDLLYYSAKCTCEEGQKCPNECNCNKGGHLAMVLGIYYKTNKDKKEIAGIYVSEAGGAGNHVSHWTIDGENKATRFAYWNCADNKCYDTKTCKEVKLIKMGSVYNSLSPKGDTENYTDMWW